MATEEYYSFEDVLRDLEIGEEELKRMVSEGELRAFRDENKMKFRKDDVDNLRKGRTTEPTLILPVSDQQQEGTGGDASETVLDLDAAPVDEAGPALDLPEPGGAKADTQDIGKVDFSDTDITVAEEPPVEVSDTAQETGVEDGMMTEPLQLVAEGATEPVPTEEAEAAAAAPVAAGARAAASRRRRQTIEITEADEAAIESRRPHWIWSIFLILAFIAAGYAGIVHYDQLRINSGAATSPTGLTKGLAEKFSAMNYNDDAWKKRVMSKDYPPNTVPDSFRARPPWQFTAAEREEAKKGVEVYGPKGSMQEGGGTPSDAPTAPPTSAPPTSAPPTSAPATPAPATPAPDGGAAAPAGTPPPAAK